MKLAAASFYKSWKHTQNLTEKQKKLSFDYGQLFVPKKKGCRFSRDQEFTNCALVLHI